MKKRMKIKVAIVDDDDIIRNGVEYILKNSKGFECVGAYASAEEALKKLNVENVNVILMDINLPCLNGIECVRELRKKGDSFNIMMLTVYETEEKIFESLAAGANGYILKNTPMNHLLKAIREIYEGGAPMSSQIARKVVNFFNSQSSKDTKSLSRREYEIVSELARGLTYEEIAEKLYISVETVRYHIKNIYSKLHVHTRTQAILKLFPKWKK